MNTIENLAKQKEKFKMLDQMKIGRPTLRVKNLDRMLGFYEGIFGLNSKSDKNRESVRLGFRQKPNGSAEPLLILKPDSKARDPPHNFAGLFHFAILVPDRRSLALAYSSLSKNGIQFDGFADHLVSESLYLHDPERNGIEIYRDRPPKEWAHDARGHVIMDTIPLDIDGILAGLSKEDIATSQEIPNAFPNGARIGHMHFRVTDLERSVRFYHERLGLDISADMSSMGAMFLSAGGYHHHIGLNTWHSLGGKPHEASEAGLDSFTIGLPRDNSFVAELESRLENDRPSRLNAHELLIFDPDGIPIRITTKSDRLGVDRS